MSQQIIVESSAYTTTIADFGVLCNTGMANGPVALNLPSLPTRGLVQWFKNIGPFPCVVNGNGFNIDNAPFITIAKQDDAYSMQFDGATWWVISAYVH